MELVGLFLIPGGGVGAVAVIAVLCLFGMLRWLGQEKSTDLQGKSLQDYPRPVIQLNSDCKIIAFNDAAVRWVYSVLEIDLRDYAGKALRVALPVADEKWPSSADNQPPEPIEIEFEDTADRSELVALEDEDESGWFVEIHENVSGAPEVKRVRNFYEEVLDNLPVELALISPTGQYLYANQALGGAKEVRQWFVGKTDFDYFNKLNLSPEFALRRRSQRREVLQHREPVSFTEQIPLQDGPAYYRRMYVPIFGDVQEVQAVAFYGLDVTRQKLYAEEAARGREQFSRFSRLKSTFLQNLSHEFRTPISSMISAAEVISNEAKEELIEFAQMIEDNGHRLIHTLQNMSQLVKLEEDGISLNPAPVDMVKTMRQLSEQFLQHAQRRGLYLTVESERNELFALVDEAALTQIGQALIDNAIKFTEEGGVLVELFIRDGRAFFQVMDTGIGMHDQFLSRLFEPFEQESEGLSRSFQGTGIGLHLVHEMINQMDGDIRVTTKKGEGSTFTVQLPLPFGSAANQPEVAMVELGEERTTIISHMISKYVQVRRVNKINEANSADIVVTESPDVITQVNSDLPVLYLGTGDPTRQLNRTIRIIHPPFLQRGILENLVELLELRPPAESK